MFDTLFLAGIGVLVLSLFASRSMTAKAADLLDNEQRAAIAKKFNKVKSLSLIPLAVAVVLYFLLMNQFQKFGMIITVSYVAFFSLILVGMNLYVYLSQKKMGLPKEYGQYTLRSQLIQLAGILLFLVAVFWPKR